MPDQMLFSLSAVAALAPSVLLPLRKDHKPDVIFWLVLVVAVVGPLNLVLASMAGSWRTDLAMSLWVTVAATMGVFAVISILAREAWRLTPLISGYMAALGVLAAIWGQASHKSLGAVASGGWIGIHIAFSVTTLSEIARVKLPARPMNTLPGRSRIASTAATESTPCSRGIGRPYFASSASSNASEGCS